MSQVWIPVIVGIIGLLGTYTASKVGKTGSRENLLIDQLQEDRDSDRKRIDTLSARMQELEQKVARFVHRDGLWALHVAQQDGLITALGGTPLQRPKELEP